MTSHTTLPKKKPNSAIWGHNRAEGINITQSGGWSLVSPISKKSYNLAVGACHSELMDPCLDHTMATDDNSGRRRIEQEGPSNLW